VTLNGAITEGQSWTLINYSSLTGTFAQGTEFTNEQGHTLSVDYGSGELDSVTLTLTTINPDATPPSVNLTRDGGIIQIEFTGTLESSATVDGPYTPVAGAVSPLQVQTEEPIQFYRARRLAYLVILGFHDHKGTGQQSFVGRLCVPLSEHFNLCGKKKSYMIHFNHSPRSATPFR
jgi:hypothetical protein